MQKWVKVRRKIVKSTYCAPIYPGHGVSFTSYSPPQYIVVLECGHSKIVYCGEDKLPKTSICTKCSYREARSLLTTRAADETICACLHDKYENPNKPGHCMACGKPFRR